MCETSDRTIQQTNRLYWDTNGNEAIQELALPQYGAYVSEEKCQLLGDVTGKKMLEIGCGNGSSLEYNGRRKAGELWGVDISENQLKLARKKLEDSGLSARLICSPMERECDIPKAYFDFVYSIYAIGWTTDLEGTFCKIASYLKKDGVFIFSWTHPFHKCMNLQGDTFVLEKSYFDDAWYPVPLEEGELLLCNRKLSTYVNALIHAGFVLERMVEETDEAFIKEQGDDSVFAKKAQMYPVTFVIKARKA